MWLLIPCIRGSIGAAMQVWDQADAANNKLAPHQLSMQINGLDVASISYDQISYVDGHQVHLDRLYIDYPVGEGAFTRCLSLRAVGTELLPHAGRWFNARFCRCRCPWRRRA